MASMEQWLSDLQEDGVAFEVTTDGQLRYSAPPGALTPTHLELIRARKHEVIDCLRREARLSEPGADVPDAPERLEPAISAQKGMWFLEQLGDRGASYHTPIVLQLEGPVQIAALERALNELVRRHEALRTTLHDVDGELKQRIGCLGASHLRLTVHDMTGAAEARSTRWVREQIDAPFDLQCGPLFRASLLQTAAQTYTLVMTLHHVIADGWSAGILHRQLVSLYEAFAAGQGSPLQGRARQLADFARWEQRWLRSAQMQKELAYWKQQLHDLPEQLELPTDRARPHVPTHGGGYAQLDFGPELVSGLERLQREQNVTLFMIVLAGFQIALSRWSGQTDVVVGSPVATRGRPETESIVGALMNLLLLRTKIDRHTSFTDFLQRVREVTLEGLSHQQLPFDALVAVLSPERHVQTQTLLQVMFTWQRRDSLVPLGREVRFRPLFVPSASAKTDLSLFIFEVPPGEGAPRALEAGIEFATDLFDAATIDRLLMQLKTLLQACVDDPGRPVWQLPMMDTRAREALLIEWNRTHVPVTAGYSVVDAFGRTAAAMRSAVAVTDGRRTLTYADLDAQSNRLASYLRLRGVDRELTVALLLHRSVDAVVAVLAVLKAGGAYVPLDPGHPAERQRYMIDSVRAAWVVTTRNLSAGLPQTSAKIIELDACREEVALQTDESPRVSILPGNLAYVIYTSGSTGRPKGAMISHAALMNYLSFAAATYDVGGGAGAPVTTSLCFDATITSLLTPLIAGTAVHVAGEEDDISALRALLNVSRPYSLLKVTPAHLELMREMYAAHELATQARVVVIGGEALKASTIAHWREHAPKVRLINEYGPTETVVGCSIHEVTPRSAHSGAIPIGRPIWNTQLYVLDPYLEPVPIGVAGELYIAGAGVARGYVQQPGLTAERFLPDPFGPPGARMYRTGDRVRHLATGELDFLGRTDHQVKLRGYRIETGEIEAQLSSHEDVTQAFVLVREDSQGDKRLVAYLVARESRLINIESVRTHVGKRLPDYMLPSTFVVLASLPLTTNGKVNRKALQAPVAHTEATAYSAPRTPLEELIAQVWASLLRLERVGIHEDFFSLGGHSLLAARIVSALRERAGTDVPLRWIFEAPTVARLAARIEENEVRNPAEDGQGEKAAPREQPIGRRPPDAAIPLSFEQEQLWFLAKLGRSGSAYNVPLALRLLGAIDIEVLERALESLVRRHDILRTRFPMHGGRPVQVIDPPGGHLLLREDLSDAEDAEREVKARVTQEMLHEFDVENGPLFRASLIRVAHEEHVLCLNVHHIISDDGTQGILLGELSQLYVAMKDRRIASLEPARIQYADYAAWQRSPVRSAQLDRCLEYWRGRLDGAPLTLNLPMDGRRSASNGAAGATEAFAIPETVSAALGRLTQNAAATPFMMFLGAYAILLSRWCGQNEVVIGCPASGRSRSDVQDVAGCFVNTLPLRISLGRGSFRELLQQIRETVIEAFAHQEVSLSQLATELNAARDPSRHPLFQVLLVVEDAVAADLLQLPGIRTSAIDASWLTSKADLTLSIKPRDASISGSIEYATALFESRTICEFRKQWCSLLVAIAANPDVPIHELSLLEHSEHRRLVEQGRGGRLHVRSGATTVHGLFEAQAATRPSAVAVSLGTHRITYAELNARVNQLAHALRAAGVTVETPVAVCLDRSFDLVVAILGVLKAGGAYVPIDPAYPAERIAYTLEDSGAAVLLTATRCEVAGARAARVIYLDSEAEAIARHPAADPTPLTDARNLMYRLYTSGSTGHPKGTDVTHENVVRLFSANQSWFEFGSADVWTLFHSYAFDFSVWELFGALLYGGRLVIVPSATARSPEALHQLLLDEHVTVLNQTPSAFRQFQAVAERALPDRRLSALRYLIFGGEALQPATLASWFAAHGSAGPQLINMYGITETTVHVTFRRITPEDTTNACQSPIGIPIPDLELHLLGPDLDPVAPGCIGELYVAGTGLSRGYHRRAALTAERFIPHPHARAPGERLYRTGDLARRRTDGEIEYLGRADGQIKLRGHRIELQEIQRCLVGAPGVADAETLVRGVDDRERRLVAWVVPSPEHIIDVMSLRAHLAATLPAFMVPAEFVVLEKMPLTANGKLDYRNLPEPSGERAEHTAYVPPRTATERVLASVWEECLAVHTVGIDDNFFACGGDSIRAVQVVYLTRERGVDMPVSLLFERQTIRELATALDATDRPSSPQRPIFVDEITVPVPEGLTAADAYPLSAMQEVMVREYARHATTARGVYHVQQLFEIFDTSPSADAMCGAFSALADAHPVLRTRFLRQGDDSLVQLVTEGACVPFIEHTPVKLFVQEAEEYGLELMRKDREQPFDLDGATLPWRVQWTRTDADRFTMLLSIHHAIDDGWGNQQMVSQLFDLYARAKQGAGTHLERRPNVFKEFVALERELQRSAESERFWRSREFARSGLDKLARRTDHGRSTGEHEITLDSTMLRELRTLARRLRLQLKAVLLDAYVEALCQELKLPQLTVGVVTNGRSARLSDALNALGLFWTMLPIPVVGEFAASRGAARIRALHDVLASAEPHAMYPAARAAGCPSLDEMLFATFNFTDFHNAAQLGDGTTLRVQGYQSSDRFHYPLNYLFAVDQKTQRLFLHAEYDDRFFSGEDIGRITDRIVAALFRSRGL